MDKRLLIIILLLQLLPAFFVMPAFSDKHKKEEVSAIITDAQNRIGAIKSDLSPYAVGDEIAKIEASCMRAQNLLSEGKIDQAYNEITLGNLYFKMIDARIELQKALQELDETRKSLSR